jgi:hypothetical protein
VKGYIFIPLVALVLFTGAFSLLGNTLVWNNTSGGNWSTAGNWTPHHVPGSSDTAIITTGGNYTVTLDVAASVSALVLGATDGSTQTFLVNGQTFSLDGPVTINSGGQFILGSGTFYGVTNNGGATITGILTPSGGALAGKFTITSNGVLNLTALGTSNTLSNLTLLTNYGTVNWSNTDLYGVASMQIFNSGLWNAQADNTMFGNGAVFNNSGVFRKSGGTNTTTLDVNTMFNSSGTVDVQSGTLAIQSGTCSGSFNTVSGSAVNLGSSPSLVTFSLTGTTIFSGGGIIEGVLINGNNALLGGTANFSAANLFGTMTISSNAVMNLDGNIGFSNIITFGGTLNNYGTVNWNNTDLYCANVITVTVNNYGLWNVNGSATFHGLSSISDHFYNFGIFRKLPGVGFANLDGNLSFVNSGLVDVENSTLAIQGGSTLNTSTFNLVSNAVVDFDGGVYGYSSYGGTSFTGNGTIRGNLTGASGGSNIISSGSITVLNSTLFGSLTVSSNATLTLASNINFQFLALNNYGTVVWNNTDLYDVPGYGGVINNYGLWNATSDNTFHGSGTTFNNYGIFRKSGGNPNVSPGLTLLGSGIAFISTGSVDVRAGLLVLSAGSGSGLFNTVNNGAVAFNPGYSLTGSVNFTGTGLIAGLPVFNNAVLNGTLRSPSGGLSGTLTVASNATLNLTTFFTSFPPPTLSLNSLVLTNYGTVIWSNANLSASSSTQIYNYGLWNALTDSTFQGNGMVFNNYGTFRDSSGSFLDLDPGLTFNNPGTVDVQSGLLEIDGPGLGSGTFNTATGTTMSLDPNYTLTGNPTFSGSGQVSGFLIGNGAVLHGTLTASGVTFSGALTVASNAVVNLMPGGNNCGFGYPNPTIFTNYGVINWGNTDLAGQANPEIDNYGLWVATGNNNTFHGNGTIFNNYGTFRDSSSNFVDLDYSVTFNNSGLLDVQNGTLEIDGPGLGSGTFNTANGALIGLDPSYYLTGNPTFTGNGQMIGFLVGNNAVLHGILTAAGATFAGTLTVASNAVVNLAPGGNNCGFGYSSPAILTNYGVINWGNTDLAGQANPEIDNYGLWLATGNNNTFHGGGTVFNNYGTFRDSSSGFVDLDPGVTFNNPGTIDVQSGTLEIDGPGLGSGTFNTATGALLGLDPSYYLTGNPTFTGNGQMIGFLVGNNAVLHGTLTTSGATFSGTLTVASNAVVNLVPGGGNCSFGYSTPAILTNYGVINWGGADLAGQANPEIDNYGLWVVTGNNNTFHGGGTVFNNYGTFRDSSSSFVDLDPGLTFNNPGTVDVQSGLLEIDGTYQLTGGTLNFGVNSSNDFGSLYLAGNATLTGTLSVNLNNGYSPAANTSFTFVGYGSETGTFTDLKLPHLSPAILWQSTYGATTFTLSVTSAPPVLLSPTAGQSGANFSFSWNGMTGQMYQVQYTTNLAPANWMNFGGTIPGVNGTMTASNLLGAEPQRYYRLVLLP